MTEENRFENGGAGEQDGAAGGKKKKPGDRRGAKKGTRNGAPICNGHTTKGKPCRNIAMANGKCYKHGGASTGPSMAGRIALSEKKTKTGERQRIYFNLLREDEVDSRISYDAKQIVEDEIFLLEIRQKRILERIHQIEVLRMEDPQIEVFQKSKKIGERPDVDPETGKMNWAPVMAMQDSTRLLVHEARMAKLTELEESLTKVTALKGKYIELREKIETKTVNEDDGSLAMLTKIIGEARKRYDGERRIAEMKGAKVVDADYTPVK